MAREGQQVVWGSVIFRMGREIFRNRLNAIKSKLLHLKSIHSINASFQSPIMLIVESHPGMKFTLMRFLKSRQEGTGGDSLLYYYNTFTEFQQFLCLKCPSPQIIAFPLFPLFQGMVVSQPPIFKPFPFKFPPLATSSTPYCPFSTQSNCHPLPQIKPIHCESLCSYAISRAVGWLSGRRQSYNQLRVIMSAEEQDEQMMEMAYQSLKIRQQNTTTYIKPRGQAEETAFDSLDPNDCSFERAIHQENMDVLKNAASRFLEESLEGDFDRELGFRDPELYQNLPFEVGGTHEMEALAGHNELLSQREQQELLGWLRREEELVGLLKESLPVFGITVGKEVVFAVYHLLRLKLEEFKTIRNPKPTIIPRFECFFGFEEEQTTLNNSCPVYDDINLQEVAKFAEKGLEDISSMLYFSCQVKYLNLREALPQTKGNPRPKFHSLIKQISRTIFFTLAGAVDTASLSGCSLALDLSREASFADFSEGSMLAIRKSMSRPFVPCEEEPVMDFSSKRRKFEQ